ncbi:hypothetical protein PoB_001470200 [Plakobranchus ocellatus]|uniref:Uncharacterized protein n=1 Tax=Plakobranchus ocellatus TaxID=259542 RepID=A0AAV3Z0Y9_9GAST|nr:hypothetical protein PoB_001470200 [Plakobranchus ocellatus]
MVTFFYCYRTCTGFLYFLDVYSEPDVSCDHLREHLRHNLLNLQRLFPDEDGILTLAFDLHIQRNLIETSLDGFGVRDVLPGQEQFQVLYERVRKKTMK